MCPCSPAIGRPFHVSAPELGRDTHCWPYSWLLGCEASGNSLVEAGSCPAARGSGPARQWKGGLGVSRATGRRGCSRLPPDSVCSWQILTERRAIELWAGRAGWATPWWLPLFTSFRRCLFLTCHRHLRPWVGLSPVPGVARHCQAHPCIVWWLMAHIFLFQADAQHRPEFASCLQKAHEFLQMSQVSPGGLGSSCRPYPALFSSRGARLCSPVVGRVVPRELSQAPVV